MTKKTIITIILVALFMTVMLLIGFFVGKSDYYLTSAWCEKSQLPDNDYEIIDFRRSELDRLFKSYYSTELDFVEQYIPKNISVKEYLGTVGTWEFPQFFKTADGNIYDCSVGMK